MKVNRLQDAVRDTKNPAATPRMRHRTARNSSQQQTLTRSSVGSATTLGDFGTENRDSSSPKQMTTTRTSGKVVAKTVKSTCPKMDFTAAITGQGSVQEENLAKSEIIAEFSYIVEFPKSHENQLSGGGVYDIISAMEKKMHRTLVENMLDCSVGGLRRWRRQLRFGFNDSTGKIRVVGVNSAPLDQVSSAVTCSPTEQSRLCMGMEGAITLTYMWEGDIEDKNGLQQQIESTRFDAVDAIRISMENGDYLDPSPVVPILRVSFAAAPSIQGLKEEATNGFPRSARYSNRIRSIVITSGVLLIALVFFLMWLNGRIKRRRDKGGKTEDSTSSTDYSTDSSTPQKNTEQQSVMFIDSIQEVWRKSWDLKIEPCQSEENTESLMDGLGNVDRVLSLRSIFSDDEVVTSPTHRDTDDEFGRLMVSKSDSFVTERF